MDEIDVIPEVQQIAGALLFAAKTPLTVGDIRKVLKQVGEARGGAANDFAALAEEEIRAALLALGQSLETARAGVHLVEVANGFRLQNDVNCGPWLRQMLDRGKANRLSKPALETLAIIAYRQPVMRSEIEAVRGVVVDQVLRTIVDMGLVKIVGRSELPGRPWLFGTTQKFLEYFGLKNVQDLPGIEELKRREAEKQARAASASISEADSAPEAEDAEEAPPTPEPAGEETSGADAEALTEETTAAKSTAESGDTESGEPSADEDDDKPYDDDEFEDDEEDEEYEDDDDEDEDEEDDEDDR